MIVIARSELRDVLFLALSVTFCPCAKYVGSRWPDLRQIHREDMFGSSLGRVWMSRSKVKDQGHQGQIRHYWPFRRPACGLCLV